MATFDIQGRLAEARARVQNIRPNLMGQLGAGGSQARLNSMRTRAQGMLASRPLLAQVRQGRFMSGGLPTGVTAMQETRNAGFRAPTGSPMPLTNGGSGYRPPT